MTSRVRKIVLAMYGYRQPVKITRVPFDTPPIYTAHCCYDAMDDLDPYQDVNPSDRHEHAPRVILGGNFGMPCA